MTELSYQNPESEQKAKEIAAEIAQKPPRKKAPPKLAVIDQSGCTGCEVCIVFCPVDCIEIVPGIQHTQLQQVVEVDLDRCIGCALCAKNCPWDTIVMLPHNDAVKEAPAMTMRSVCGQPTMSDVPEAAGSPQ